MRRSTLVTAVAAIAAALALAGGITSASAATARVTWHIAAIPMPAGGPFSDLAVTGGSCGSATSCDETGFVLNAEYLPVPFFDQWSGAAWHAVKVPLTAPGAKGERLDAVSCPLANRCVAVGNYIGPGYLTHLFVEHLTGTTHVASLPALPPGATSGFFNAVSCAAITRCVAVGGFTNAQGHIRSFVDAMTGTTWKPVTFALPAGSTGAQLTAVSCLTVASCTAVGYSTDTHGRAHATGELLVGARWSATTPATLAGAASTTLSGIACTTTATCIAVGTESTATAVQRTVVDVRTGGKWKASVAPVPAGSKNPGLASIDCASPTRCTAIGGVTDTHYNPRMLAEAYNGKAWTPTVTAATSPLNYPSFVAVSCATTSRCRAFGTAYNTKIAASVPILALLG